MINSNCTGIGNVAQKARLARSCRRAPNWSRADWILRWVGHDQFEIALKSVAQTAEVRRRALKLTRSSCSYEIVPWSTCQTTLSQWSFILSSILMNRNTCWLLTLTKTKGGAEWNKLHNRWSLVMKGLWWSAKNRKDATVARKLVKDKSSKDNGVISVLSLKLRQKANEDKQRNTNTGVK